MLVVLSFDGLAGSALGVYGSSWNETPVIDAIAATGVVMDRFVLSSDCGHENLAEWMSGDWVAQRSGEGPVVLVTDDPDAEDAASAFDEVIWVEPGPTTEIPEHIESTRLGQVMLAAIERDAGGPRPSVLWIHSRFLLDAWDAPRNVLPAAETDAGPDDPPGFPNDAEEASDTEAAGDVKEAGDVEEAGEGEEPDQTDANDEVAPFGNQPTAAVTDPEDEWEENESLIDPVFDQITPPSLTCDDRDDPDLVMSWTRTYGCQIRLIDWLTEILLASLGDEDPQVIIASTSGFSLGQNGSVGHRAGPLSSPQIQVPMIVSDVATLRWPKVCGNEMMNAALAGTLNQPISPASFAESGQAAITSGSTRAKRAITTDDWFYVADPDGRERLYVKPDDVDDINDVARLSPGIIDELISGELPQRS